MDTRNELMFANLCKISPIGIEVIDMNKKRLLSANSWTYEHMGYSREEFEDASANLFEKLIHPEDRPIQLAAYEALKNNPGLHYKEFGVRVKRQTGEYSHACIRLSVLELDSENNPLTMLCVVTDVSEIISLRERLDTELKKIDIISYKNSHELRGPVATILGLIQLIDYTGFDGVQSKEIITALKETVTKLDNVIHEINRFSY